MFHNSTEYYARFITFNIILICFQFLFFFRIRENTEESMICAINFSINRLKYRASSLSQFSFKWKK